MATLAPTTCPNLRMAVMELIVVARERKVKESITFLILTVAGPPAATSELKALEQRTCAKINKRPQGRTLKIGVLKLCIA